MPDILFPFLKKHKASFNLEEKRVKVAWGQLKKWYRAGDILFSHKKEIYLKLRNLFSIKVDLVFYDLTSTYFAQREPKGDIKRQSHSRDEKKDVFR